MLCLHLSHRSVPMLHAQIVVSANDSKSRLVDGVNSTVPNAPPDTVTIIEIAKGQPRILAEIPVPNSIVGPPQNVAISPDGALALVTSSTQARPCRRDEDGARRQASRSSI